MTADLAEYYHIYDMRSFRASLIAVYVTQLREDSRTMMAFSGQKSDFKTILLAEITDGVNWLMWSKTKDAQRGKGMPRRISDRLLGVEEEKQCTAFNSPEDFRRAWAALTEESQDG